MPDMDGFNLLEHVGLEMDLLVIMMSVDRETSKVMRGVQHGACDYLLKPIRMKELRHIWQHVFRKRIHELAPTSVWHDPLNCPDIDYGIAIVRHDDKDFVDPSSVKKARVVWTVDLHQKFVKKVMIFIFVWQELQKENGLKALFGGVKQLDLSSRDDAASLGL
ncbi:hypothetical protein HYC85_012914 [Camellia sinensis]|uniref:Response regulatory domain-containing protein n=1 Tax=Camellia sinensis TaxID=4442 RepID=A0A7J7HFC2_CAMSI|nr:hypothetical protein HYC85_012914 [Camellia sinensis]